jgi:capsular polysaccharide biosynthesis protein
MPLSRDLGTTLSTEAKLHGGFLHLAREDLSQRLAVASPSLYDCLLAAIYFRKVGDQGQALQALALHSGSGVFETTYNRLQSLCLNLDFAAAEATALEALEAWANDWSHDQRGYVIDVSRTTACLTALGPFPTELKPSLIAHNGYHNLDSGELTSCTGIVDHNRRLARLVDGLFDPASQCWIERNNGRVVGELLQPNHDFRAFFGGASPWRLVADAHRQPAAEELMGTAVFVESNPHFGHFLTQAASYANAIGYAQHLTPASDPTITVLSKGEIPTWAQALLQASTASPLRFVVLDPQRPLRAGRLVVVPPTWIEWHYVHRDHQRLFRQAAWGWQQQGLGGSGAQRVYFSRSRVEGGLRHSQNETALEEALRQRGFAVVHPQELPLAEVAALVNGASLIAGPMGSAMHNVLFRLPDTPPLITLNFAHFLPGTNNALVERCSGIHHNVYLRSCEEASREPGQPGLLEFNLERCLEGVDQVLAQLESLS